MQVRIVEVAALDAPHLAEHLLPLGDGVDPHVQCIELQHALAWLDRRGSGRDHELRRRAAAGLARLAASEHQEHLVAVVRDVEGVDAVGELLDLARLQLEPGERVRALRLVPERLRNFLEHVEDARAARLQVHVIPRGNRQRHDPLRHVRQVDAHRLWRRRLFRGRCFWRRRLLFVALGRHGRGNVRRQHERVDAARDLVLVARHVEQVRPRTVVGARREVQVLAVAIERGISRVAQPIGHLRALPRVKRIQEYAAQMIRQIFGIREPFAVRRPRRIQCVRWIFIAVRIDSDRRTLVDIHVPEVEALIGVRNLLTIRRPPRIVEIGRRIPKIDLLHRAESRLAGEMERVFSRLIREVRDPLAVRRPGGIPVGHGIRPRQVANVAFLGGHRQDFSMRFKHSPRAGWREVGMHNLLRHLLVMGPRRGQVARDAYIHLFRLATRGIGKINSAELLINERIRPGRKRFEIESVVGNHLLHRFHFRVVGKRARPRPRHARTAVSRRARPARRTRSSRRFPPLASPCYRVSMLG